MENVKPCKVCGGVNVYFFKSRGDFSFSHPCNDKNIQRFGFVSTEEALIIWNLENRPGQEPEPEPPSEEPETPALKLTPRKKREGLKVKKTFDDAGLNIIEVEIGFSEMRKYSTHVNGREEIGSERIENAALRAKVEAGDDPQAIMEALRQMAGRMVARQHADFELELEVKAQETLNKEQALVRELNGFLVDWDGPSYFTSNIDPPLKVSE